jgi:hypothetical protein
MLPLAGTPTWLQAVVVPPFFPFFRSFLDFSKTRQRAILAAKE